MLGFPFTKVFILSKICSHLPNVHLYNIIQRIFSIKFHTVDLQNPKQPPRMMIIPLFLRVEKPSQVVGLGMSEPSTIPSKICSEARLERGHKGIAFRPATGIGWILGFLIRNGGLIEGGVGLAACWFCGFRGGDLKKKLEKQKMWIWGKKKDTSQFCKKSYLKKHKKPQKCWDKNLPQQAADPHLCLNILHDRKCRNSGLASKVWNRLEERKGGEWWFPCSLRFPQSLLGILKVRTLQFS